MVLTYEKFILIREQTQTFGLKTFQNLDLNNCIQAQPIFVHCLISTSLYFVSKNLNSLNFAAVMVSLFTGGISKLGSGLLSAFLVECEP